MIVRLSPCPWNMLTALPSRQKVSEPFIQEPASVHFPNPSFSLSYSYIRTWFIHSGCFIWDCASILGKISPRQLLLVLNHQIHRAGEKAFPQGDTVCLSPSFCVHFTAILHKDMIIHRLVTGPVYFVDKGIAQRCFFSQSRSQHTSEHKISHQYPLASKTKPWQVLCIGICSEPVAWAAAGTFLKTSRCVLFSCLWQENGRNTLQSRDLAEQYWEKVMRELFRELFLMYMWWVSFG